MLTGTAPGPRHPRNYSISGKGCGKEFRSYKQSILYINTLVNTLKSGPARRARPAAPCRAGTRPSRPRARHRPPRRIPSRSVRLLCLGAVGPDPSLPARTPAPATRSPGPGPAPRRPFCRLRDTGVIWWSTFRGMRRRSRRGRSLSRSQRSRSDASGGDPARERNRRSSRG